MRYIVGGLVLIASGLVRRRSVFLGDHSLSSIIFDSLGIFFVILGIFFVIRGAMRLHRARQEAKPPA